MEFEQILQLIDAVSGSELASFDLEKDGIRLSMTTDKMPAEGMKKKFVPDRTETGAEAENPGLPNRLAGNRLSGKNVSASGDQAVEFSEKRVSASGDQTVEFSEKPAGGQAAGISETGAAVAGSLALDGLVSDKLVKAPLVGIFYAAPSEDAEPFVKVGDSVKKGQVLGIIEAMKLMNEIESEYDGIVDAVLIENEQVVEYGQPLFRLR